MRKRCAHCRVIAMLCVFGEDEAPPDTAGGEKAKKKILNFANGNFL